MADIFLAHAREDDAFARAFAHGLERQGWSVWPGSETIYSETHHGLIEAELEDAACVIVLWSENARRSRWVLLEAIAGLNKGRLLQITLDTPSAPEGYEDAPLIASTVDEAGPNGHDWPTIVDLVQSFAGAGAQSGRPQSAVAAPTILTPLDPIDRPDLSKPPPHTPPSPPQDRVGLFGKLLAGALGAVAIGSVAYVVLEPPAPIEDIATENTVEAARVDEQNMVSAVEVWARTPRSDPAMIRAFLETYPEGPAATDARGHLDALRKDAWAKIAALDDAEAAMSALADFEARFPLATADASREEFRRRQIAKVRTIESRLAQLGFPPGRIDGVISAATRRAANAFDRSMGLPPREKFTDALARDLAFAIRERDMLEDLTDNNDGQYPPSENMRQTPWEFQDAPDPPLQEEDERQGTRDPAEPDAAEIAAATDAPSLNDETAALVPLETAGRIDGGQTSSATPDGAQDEEDAPLLEASPAASTVDLSQPASEDPSALREIQDCEACPLLVVAPAGFFVMGDISGVGDPDERPLRDVEIRSPFAIGKYEVTFDEWRACSKDGGCERILNDEGWGRGDRPVINVSWSAAQDYVNWLSQKAGTQYRLPTEAEWEYAARAGATTDYAFGDDEIDLCAHANGADAGSAYQWRNLTCDDGFPDRTAPVGSFRPNAFGLHDMHGNVWEWVEDCWRDNGYTNARADGRAAVKKCSGEARILRGGSFSVQSSYLRSAYRYSFMPEMAMPFFGFRVVRDVAQ